MMIPPIHEAHPSRDEVPAVLADALERGAFRGPVHWRGHVGICGEAPRVGMVGTREPGPRSLLAMRDLAQQVAGQGAVVVSGAARGTDMACHLSAIGARGGSVACVPGGLAALDLPHWRPDFVSPLAVGNLLLLSVFPRNQEVTTQTPAVRNRLIAALAEVLVVGEAHTTSGTHLCTRAALAMGVPVFFLREAEGAGDLSLQVLHRHLTQRGAEAFTAEQAADGDLVVQILAAATRHREQRRAADEAQLRLF